MAAVQAREKAVRAAEVASAKKESAAERAAKKPETNTKKYNVGLLRSYKAISIKVERQNENGDTLTHRFEIPQEPDFSFPNANQEGGVSVAEVALATRQFFQRHHPEKLMEKVETFLRCKGWELIWTPPYMPSFRPIELFWAHGKRYVSLNFQLKRKMSGVWEQLRKRKMLEAGKLCQLGAPRHRRNERLDREVRRWKTVWNNREPCGCRFRQRGRARG